ncbi:hypothetical protein [Saccharopolyspora hattusasensis]
MFGAPAARPPSAPVVARMLGYTLDHAARLATEAGGAWAPLRPDDHCR